MFNLSNIIYLVIAVVLSMSIHETAHGLVSYWMGDPTAKIEGRLSFNPFKHVDWIGLVCLLVCGLAGQNQYPWMHVTTKMRRQESYGQVLRVQSQTFY